MKLEDQSSLMNFESSYFITYSASGLVLVDQMEIQFMEFHESFGLLVLRTFIWLRFLLKGKEIMKIEFRDQDSLFLLSLFIDLSLKPT